MQQDHRPEGFDFLPRQMRRSQSVSSDRTSVSTAPSVASPPPVSPDPAYIAASAASQIVTSDYRSQIDDWFHPDGEKEELDTITVAPASLTLINGFLDHLLFSILAVARSTSIASLRPAVAEVLKPRLAKDAIDGADQELKEFLGGGDAEERSASSDGQHLPRGRWDLNRVWRRTRLRCMVYTRLGDMEEEDEEMYIEQEQREHATNGDGRMSRELARVSPAAAIFLTSILEYIGEHALMVAGEAASNRIDIRPHRDGQHASAAAPERPRRSVEEIDVEKLAFNTTLGRLWRSWKKRVRATSLSGSRPLSREMTRRRAASASASPCTSEVGDPAHLPETGVRPSVAEVLEEERESARSPRDREIDAKPRDHGVPEPSSRPPMRHRAHSMLLDVQPSMEVSSTPVLPSSSSSNTAPGVPSMGTYPQRRKRSASLPNLQCASTSSPPNDTGMGPAEAPALPREDVQSQGDEVIPPDERNQRRLSEDALSEPDGILAPAENGEPVDLGTLSGYTGPQSSEYLSGSTMVIPGMTSFRVDRGRESLTKPPVELAAGVDQPRSGDVEKASDISMRAADHAAGDARVPSGAKEIPTGPSQGRTEMHGMNRPLGGRGPDLPPLYTGGTSRREWERHLKSLQEIPPSTLAVHHGHPAILNATTEMGEEGRKHSDTPFPPPAASIPGSHALTPDVAHRHTDTDHPDWRQIPKNAAAHPLGAEYGVSSVTRLKEVLDGSRPNTSDGSPPVTLNDDTSGRQGKPSVGASVDHNPARPGSNSLPPSALLPSGESSRTAEEEIHKRKTPSSVDVGGPERATVQRITPSPKEQSMLSRTSTISNREVRPPTAASGTSQFSQKVKGFIGRESIESAATPRAKRPSSEGSGSTSGGKRGAPTSVAVIQQESFEQLIQSDETIQYTLTPRSVRELETRAAPKLGLHQAPGDSNGSDSHSGSAPANVERRTSTSGVRSATSIKSLDGLRPHLVAGTNGIGLSVDRSPSLIGSEQTAKKPVGLANGRPGAVVSRDARAVKETTSEMANFIRSTGPESIRQLPPSEHRPGSVTPKATPSEQSHSRKVTKPHPTLVPKSAGTASSKKSGPRLQARDAVVSHDSQTSDLIDFIRQGPDRSDGSRRIPRSVAPFRRTMDSDEIQCLGTGTAKDASSVTSTQDGRAQSQSLRSSSNSRTGLLESAKRWNGGQHHGSTSDHSRLDEAPHLPRKQRRVKDPYAIDIEDEDDGLHDRSQPEPHEETLAEFLRSVAPPRKGPHASGFNSTLASNLKPVTKKSNGPEPLARATSSVQSAKAAGSKTSVTNIAGVKGARGRDKSRLPPTPLETSPHRATPNGTKPDSYHSAVPTYGTHPDRDRTASGHSRLQPRGERGPEPGLSDLADFLKNSGPPTPPLEPRPPVLSYGKEKEEGGFSRLFRRKKSAARL